MQQARERLATAFAPELVDALEQLVEEQLRKRLENHENEAASPWMSVQEAADYLRISPRHLERSIRKGRLSSTTLGRRRLLHRDDLNQFARAATREDVTPATPSRRRGGTLDAIGARS